MKTRAVECVMSLPGCIVLSGLPGTGLASKRSKDLYDLIVSRERERTRGHTIGLIIIRLHHIIFLI